MKLSVWFIAPLYVLNSILYNLLSEKEGHKVDWFCKSMEDLSKSVSTLEYKEPMAYHFIAHRRFWKCIVKTGKLLEK